MTTPTSVLTSSVPASAPLRGAGLPEAVTRFYSRYAQFSGRAGRGEFWWVALALGVFALVIGGVGPILAATSALPDSGAAPYLVIGAVAAVFVLGHLVPVMSLTARRLRDAGLPPLLTLLHLVPVVGTAVLLVLAARPSSAAVDGTPAVDAATVEEKSLLTPVLIAAGIVAAITLALAITATPKFVQLVIEGLSTGSIYAALALAIVLVNRATGLINFAQGGMAVVSTFVAFALSQQGLPLPLAILGAVVFAFVFGAVIERVVIRPFEHGDPDTAVVATIGLLVFLTGVAAFFFGYEPQQFRSFFGLETLNVAGVFVSLRSLGTIVVLVAVVVLLQVLFRGTKIGLAMRAVADNPQSASLSGLPVSRLLMVGWGLASVLGAIAGVLVAPQLAVSPGMLNFVLVYALAAAILGGLDSPLGAVVAAWFIGVIENLSAAYIEIIGNDLKIAVPFIVMIIVLIVRPQGLFGRKVVVRV